MFTYQELMEMDNLCKENAIFKKYVDRCREESNRMMSKLTHEIGNPLTLVYSTMQLMEEKSTNIKEVPYWNQLSEDIRDLVSIVKSYSDYNYEETLNVQSGNLAELVNSVVGCCRPILEEEGIQISIEEPVTISEKARKYPCDSVKLRGVLLNILKSVSKAVRTSAADEKRKIGVRFQENASQFLIEIESNGKPMDQEELKEGKDLAASYRIIKAHGGNMETAFHQGWTRLTICLPL